MILLYLSSTGIIGLQLQSQQQVCGILTKFTRSLSNSSSIDLSVLS